MSSAALDANTNAAVPRSRLVAAVLSLLAPGVGHLYAGAPRRAAVAFAAMLALPLLLVVAAYAVPPAFGPLAGFCLIALVVGGSIYLATMIDAARSAARAPLAPRLGWGVLIAAMLGVWAAHYAVSFPGPLIKQQLPWRTFSIASTSMAPTLRRGEWVIADTAYYSRNEPMRGDAVMYRLPGATATIHVKRIVALPGDRVAFRGGRAIVNGVAADEPFADFGDATALLNTTAEVTVPEGHVFVAGDNRANAADSRVAGHGPVPLKALVARATEIFLTDDSARAGLWVGSPVR